jgi:hypothetical protein
VFLDAMVALAISWGWVRWAALTSLAFHGVMRIGEPLLAVRSDLMLPSEAFLDPNVCFVRVGAPKPGRRGRGKVQHARVTDLATVQLAEFAFGKLERSALLYPISQSSFRRRWDALLKALGVPKHLGLTPACVRGGGAVTLYHQSVSVPDILWRMRLRHIATLEFYLQESAATNLMQQVPKSSKQQLLSCASMLPHLMRSLISQAAPTS